MLLACERDEVASWNPALAAGLRDQGVEVVVTHDLDEARAAAPHGFDACLPRFRSSCASMSAVDELLVRSGVPMVNSRECRRACENKAVAHLAFEEAQIPQPPSLVIDADGLADRAARWSGETLIKPLHGSRGSGIEILPSADDALARARSRREDLLVQQVVWPARCWRVIVGRNAGAVDPYWRRPPRPDERILSISTGSTIRREPPPPAVSEVALAMLEAVAGDLLAADVLERDGRAWALEINHNFDAHGGTAPAVEAFRREIEARIREAVPAGGRATPA